MGHSIFYLHPLPSRPLLKGQDFWGGGEGCLKAVSAGETVSASLIF